MKLPYGGEPPCRRGRFETAFVQTRQIRPNRFRIDIVDIARPPERQLIVEIPPVCFQRIAGGPAFRSQQIEKKIGGPMPSHRFLRIISLFRRKTGRSPERQA